MPFSADAVQGICFIEPSSRPNDAMATWQTIFAGASPDGFQRVANSPALQSAANGESDGFFFTLNVQVGRLELIIESQHPQALVSTDSPPPRIDDVARATNVLARHLKKIATSHKTIRIAIVLDLSMELLPGDEANAMRQHLARLSLPPGATDLQFQVNVRRRFASRPEVAMNRVCSWSTGQAGFVQMTPAGPISTAMRPIVSLKLDINTAPEIHVPGASSDSIISELADEALRLHMMGLDGLWGDGTVSK